jgi:inner membrane protein
MLGRSHFVLAGAGYAALTLRPLETSYGTLAAPLLGGLTEDQAANLLLSLLIAAASGLAPDIDKVGSTASRSLGIPTRVLSWGIERSFGHRGGFHSLLALVLAYYAGDLAGGLVGLTGFGGLLAFGWAVHLVTDAWTVHGVPLFWPLTSGRVRLPPRLSTGSALEAVVLVISLVLLAAYATWPYLAPYAWG